jgi:hypothetical protein
MRRGGYGRDAKRRVKSYRKMAGRKWEGVGCWLCLPTNSGGWVLLSTKVSDHTLNLLSNFFFSPKINPDSWSSTALMIICTLDNVRNTLSLISVQFCGMSPRYSHFLKLLLHQSKVRPYECIMCWNICIESVNCFICNTSPKGILPWFVLS